MGCTSSKKLKKNTSSVEDVSLQKGSATQTHASNKNGQIGNQSNVIQIPGAAKSFLAPDGIPFIDEDVDEEGEQLHTTKINDISPAHQTTTTTTTTVTTNNNNKPSALQAGVKSHQIATTEDRPNVIDAILQKEARTVQHQEPQAAGRTSAERANAENTSRQQDVAATKIQAGIRGFLDRKKVRAMREQQQNNNGVRPGNNKGHHVTSNGDPERQVLTDRADIEVRYADASDDPKMNSAATKIQANYKGYKTRKQMKLKK